ncbi:MAG: ATP-binding protein [Candidatus Thorarchaeota archaeon]|jgi:DNA replication protein DnaC
MQRERIEAEKIVDQLFPEKLPLQTREFLISRFSTYDSRYCANCFQTGYIFKVSGRDVKTSSCLCLYVVKRNEDVAKSFKESNIPERYYDAHTDKWLNMGTNRSELKINETSFQTALAYSKSLTRMRKDGYGLFLCGPNGVGKTFLACAIGNCAVKSRFMVRYYTMAMVVQMHIRGWYEEDANQIVENIRNSDFLIVDDLDKIYKTKTGIESSLFDNLLRERLQRMMPCIFTSNKTLESARGDYGSSIHSMLIEQCAELVFVGSDHRVGMSDAIKKKIINNGNS